MEELIARYKQLVQAYGRLDYMAKKFVELSQSGSIKQMTIDEENEYMVNRDGLIKRFEFCYELTWKYLKLKLKKEYGLDIASPRKVFKECYTQGILTTSQAELLNEIVDVRNETTHVYDESKADSISQQIINFTGTLIDIIKELNPEL